MGLVEADAPCVPWQGATYSCEVTQLSNLRLNARRTPGMSRFLGSPPSRGKKNEAIQMYILDALS